MDQPGSSDLLPEKPMESSRKITQPWKSRGMSGIQHANEAIDSISPHWGHGDLENPQDPKSLGKETRTSHEILVSHRCFLLTMVD